MHNLLRCWHHCVCTVLEGPLSDDDPPRKIKYKRPSEDGLRNYQLIVHTASKRAGYNVSLFIDGQCLTIRNPTGNNGTVYWKDIKYPLKDSAALLLPPGTDEAIRNGCIELKGLLREFIKDPTNSESTRNKLDQSLASYLSFAWDKIEYRL